MKHTLPYLLSMLLITACFQSNQQPDNSTPPADSSITAVKHDSATAEPEGDELVAASVDIDSATHARLKWIDSIAYIALQSSDNILFQDALKDSSIRWIWDGLTGTDTATYIALQVGRHIEDEEASHFATYGWLYVDTLSRDVYEYKVASDSFIKLSTIPINQPVTQ